MSGRKDVLLPFQIFSQSSLQASLESQAINIQYLDNIAIELNWVGYATGSFNVQGAINHNPRFPNLTKWKSITLNPAVTATGGDDDALINMDLLSFPWIRVTFLSTYQSASVTTTADVLDSLSGLYFLIDAVDVTYAVWYNTGASIAPVVPGATLVEVTIVTNDTADAVATATEAALQGLTGISLTSVSTNIVLFNIDSVGGSVTAGTTSFTVVNTDIAGVVDGFISAKMI